MSTRKRALARNRLEFGPELRDVIDQAPFCLPELRMAPPDQARGSGPSSGLIGIARNNDGGDGMEETEAEEKERNAAKRKRDKVVVNKTPRNRPVSKSIMEALWTTFKMKHQVRTAEAVRLAGDLAISFPGVTAWFQSTRRKHQEMAKVQKKATKSAQDEVFHSPLHVLPLKRIGKGNSFYVSSSAPQHKPRGIQKSHHLRFLKTQYH
ncbi:NANOG neighbor homeobox-like [Tachyglossus aculeatus]|uniref:NANOG neighbor homeobox-like n=1 Tax=Tachyglossus aculeatus TaxID=9261 RepID=UPI0018F46DFD|nr:NANOG neighbor homeobox-like [Tachyglossus aculeatus]